MKRKAAALLAAVCLMAGVFAGCGSVSSREIKDYPDITVATFGSEKINLAEVNYYMRSLQYAYELYYGSYYGDELWTQDYNESLNYGEYIRSMMVNKVYQIHLLNQHAAELGVSLSDEDKAKVEEGVELFLTTGAENVLAATEMDREDVVAIYENNALANRVYEAMVADIDREVDEESIHKWEFKVVSLDSASETYDAQEVRDGILAAMDEGTDIDTAAAEYDLTATVYHIGEGEYAQTLGPTALALSTGEYDSCFSTDNGYYYVIYCVDDYDEEATEAARQEVIAEREAAKFTEVYTGWVESAPELKVDEDVLGLLTFDKAMYVADAQ